MCPEFKFCFFFVFLSKWSSFFGDSVWKCRRIALRSPLPQFPCVNPEDAGARPQLSPRLAVGPGRGQLAWGPLGSAAGCVLPLGSLGSLGLLGPGPASELRWHSDLSLLPALPPPCVPGTTRGLVAAVGGEEAFCLGYSTAEGFTFVFLRWSPALSSPASWPRALWRVAPGVWGAAVKPDRASRSTRGGGWVVFVSLRPRWRRVQSSAPGGRGGQSLMAIGQREEWSPRSCPAGCCCPSRWRWPVN